MTHEIKTYKGNDGWRAESIAVLSKTPEGTRKLEICTYKTRGGITAYATVYLLTDEYTKVSEIPGDFRKHRLVQIPCNRVTEKTIITAHEEALKQMDALIAEAKEFYIQKDKEEAA